MNKKTLFDDRNKSIKKVELQELAKDHVYPVTIVIDRYGGTYSGSKWLALQLYPESIPEEIGGGDPDEMIFWREHSDKTLPIGKGDTPDLALVDLKKRLNIYYENW